MGFFQTMKRLFQGYDITRGSSETPRNREERRAQARVMKRKQKEEVKVKGRAM